MPTPDFVLRLRERVGHDPLWLIGVSAVVLDDEGRLLLTRRRDTGRWALVGGIVEPGEDPAPAAQREVVEETGVEAELVRYVSLLADPPTRYPNGDQVQFLTSTYLFRATGGEARVADDENLEVAWFALDERPELSEVQTERLRLALVPDAPLVYRTAPAPPS